MKRVFVILLLFSNLVSGVAWAFDQDGGPRPDGWVLDSAGPAAPADHAPDHPPCNHGCHVAAHLMGMIPAPIPLAPPSAHPVNPVFPPAYVSFASAPPSEPPKA